MKESFATSPTTWASLQSRQQRVYLLWRVEQHGTQVVVAAPGTTHHLVNLSVRRGELDRKEQRLDERESLIAAAEARIDAKIEEKYAYAVTYAAHVRRMPYVSAVPEPD